MKNNNAIKAKKLYEAGKSIAEIATALGVAPATVRSWKSRHKWGNQMLQLATESATPQKNNKKAELLAEPLTDKERLFAEIFIKNRNATQAAIKAGYSLKSAHVIGYENLRKPKIKSYIDYLRELKREAIMIDQVDIVEKYIKIAFADITDFADFGTVDVPVFDDKGNMVASKERDFLRIYDAQTIDGGIVKEVKQTKEGLSIKLEDRMAALAWLADYFELNPMDRHKKEYDNRKQELERERFEHDKEIDGNKYF